MPTPTPNPTPEQLTAVLDAADALLCARANQMVTCVEWEDLERAVAACRPPTPEGQNDQPEGSR